MSIARCCASCGWSPSNPSRSRFSASTPQLSARSYKLRAVKRLRTLRFRSYLLPLILAAIAGRALAPEAFMTMAGSSTSVLTTTTCSLDRQRRERLSQPAETGHGARCDHCLNGPMGWAPIAFLNIGVVPLKSPLLAPPETSQVAGISILRSQVPRAPPHA